MATPVSQDVETREPNDLSALVTKLRNSFQREKTRPEAWRREQLKQMRAMLTDHQEAFVEAVAADSGRPHFEVWSGDLAMSLGEIDAALKGLKKWMAPKRGRAPASTFPGGSAEIVPSPLGVALVIAPWNFPLELALNPAIGAIAAGNCVVIKPSEIANKTAALLARHIPEYLDTDCIAVVEGGIEETQALLKERFDHIFYTGNGRVGRIILEAAAPHLTPVTLELGGKSPCIVAHDANLKVAARRICLGKYFNAGQTCVAPDYLLVDERVKAEFIGHMRKTIKHFYGDDPKQSADFGRIANQRHFDRLVKLLEGYDPVIGGETDPTQRYISPTVLDNVGLDTPVMQEEIFGPILPVLGVANVEEAITFVNERPKPLALYVFTKDRDTQTDVLSRVSAGGACVNATIVHTSTPHLPFGGVGESGMGRYHGHASFETFSHYMTVVKQSTSIDLPLIYPPYTPTKVAITKMLI